jgi:hypothetical protein
MNTHTVKRLTISSGCVRGCARGQLVATLEPRWRRQAKVIINIIGIAIIIDGFVPCCMLSAARANDAGKWC